MLIQAIGTAMAGDPNKLSHTKAMRRIMKYAGLADPPLSTTKGQKDATGVYRARGRSLHRNAVEAAAAAARFAHAQRPASGCPGFSEGLKFEPTCALCSSRWSRRRSKWSAPLASPPRRWSLSWKGDLAEASTPTKTPKCATPNTIKHGLSDPSGDIDLCIEIDTRGGPMRLRACRLRAQDVATSIIIALTTARCWRSAHEVVARPRRDPAAARARGRGKCRRASSLRELDRRRSPPPRGMRPRADTRGVKSSCAAIFGSRAPTWPRSSRSTYRRRRSPRRRGRVRDSSNTRSARRRRRDSSVAAAEIARKIVPSTKRARLARDVARGAATTTRLPIRRSRRWAALSGGVRRIFDTGFSWHFISALVTATRARARANRYGPERSPAHERCEI